MYHRCVEHLRPGGQGGIAPAGELPEVPSTDTKVLDVAKGYAPLSVSISVQTPRRLTQHQDTYKQQHHNTKISIHDNK